MPKAPTINDLFIALKTQYTQHIHARIYPDLSAEYNEKIVNPAKEQLQNSQPGANNIKAILHDFPTPMAKVNDIFDTAYQTIGLDVLDVKLSDLTLIQKNWLRAQLAEFKNDLQAWHRSMLFLLTDNIEGLQQDIASQDPQKQQQAEAQFREKLKQSPYYQIVKDLEEATCNEIDSKLMPKDPALHQVPVDNMSAASSSSANSDAFLNRFFAPSYGAPAYAWSSQSNSNWLLDLWMTQQGYHDAARGHVSIPLEIFSSSYSQGVLSYDCGQCCQNIFSCCCDSSSHHSHSNHSYHHSSSSSNSSSIADIVQGVAGVTVTTAGAGVEVVNATSSATTIPSSTTGAAHHLRRLLQVTMDSTASTNYSPLSSSGVNGATASLVPQGHTQYVTSLGAKIGISVSYGLLILPRVTAFIVDRAHNVYQGYKTTRSLIRLASGVAIGTTIAVLADMPQEGGPNTAIALGGGSLLLADTLAKEIMRKIAKTHYNGTSNPQKWLLTSEALHHFQKNGYSPKWVVKFIRNVLKPAKINADQQQNIKWYGTSKILTWLSYRKFDYFRHPDAVAVNDAMQAMRKGSVAQTKNALQKLPQVLTLFSASGKQNNVPKQQASLEVASEEMQMDPCFRNV